MGNLIIPQSVTRNLPFAVTAQLAELPEQAQKEFFNEFNRKTRSVAVGYLLHFFLYANYGYLNKWFLQILFWMTGGGFGIWWFIDLFRIPGMVKNHNHSIADEVLKNVLVRYKLYGKGSQQPRNLNAPPTPIVKPREFKVVESEFAEFSIASLKVGYGFEYNVDTWEAVEESQYDWDNGMSEKVFKLVSLEGLSNSFLFLKKEGERLVNIYAQKINIYALDEKLEQEILDNQRPRNILEYEGVSYYRENRKEGLRYKNLQQNTKGQKIIAWEYYNQEHTHFLRIEQLGRNAFDVRIGKVASDYEFSDIYKIMK